MQESNLIWIKIVLEVVDIVKVGLKTILQRLI